MATAERAASFLPALKCSTCGDEIDIVNLADHVCRPSTKAVVGGNSGYPTFNDGIMKGDPAIQSGPSLLLDPAVQQQDRPFLDIKHHNAPGLLKPGLQIDPAAANRPFLQPEAAVTPGSDYSSYTNEQGLTPVTPSTQITTPSSMFSRKPSYPSRSPSPPSPAFASNLDSAFPPFRSRYDNPGSFSGQQNFMRAPPSPGANVISRMNGVAQGPFSGQQRGRTATNNAQNGPTGRRPSQEQYNPYADVAEQDPYGRTPEPQAPGAQNGANPSAGASRKVVNSIDMFLRDVDDEPPVSSMSPEQRSRTFPEDNKAPLLRGPKDGFMSPILSAAPEKTEFSPNRNQSADEQRPKTSAGSSANKPAPQGRFDAFRDPGIHNPFIPASRQRAPSIDTSRANNHLMPVTDANSPDQDPKSPWFEAPRKSPLPPGMSGRARSKTQSRPNEPTAVERFLNNQPPAPALPMHLRREGSSGRSDISHSPSDSSSSYASNSTAPSSVGSSLSRNASSDSTRSHRRGISRSNRPEPLPAPSLPAAANLPQPLESPVDPAVHHMRAPLDPAIQLGASPRSLLSDSPPRMRPVNTRADITATAPPRFQAPISKGECRGCGTNIYGKSVKAADGRLTGRYHKECFVCKTCQAPFPSAEFYVHGNAPYCAHHYHELNGSLCRKCDKGIEGEYLETDRREKFHAQCFCCAHCRVRLNMDYYEVGGRPYCERHALAIPRQRGLGAPPVAERRRTRLGFM